MGRRNEHLFRVYGSHNNKFAKSNILAAFKLVSVKQLNFYMRLDKAMIKIKYSFIIPLACICMLTKV